MAKKVLASGLSRVVHPVNEKRSTLLNVASPQQATLPFFGLLPKAPLDLMRWKIYVRDRCLTDLEFRADIDEMCRQDIAFFAATFCWTFETRPPRGIPLIPWVDQIDCLIWMKECFDTERDCGIEKTRGLFMSWTTAILLYWCWRYVPDCKIAYTTKDETTLDGPDANSFLGKIAYLHEKMPAWMQFDKAGLPVLKRTLDQHLLVNLANGATIQGFPPTNQKLRSLRFTIVIYDEFAFFPRDAQESLNSSGHTAPCRIFISTWHGHGNVFHQVMRVEKSTMLRLEAYWWNNYERWRGCYTTEHGRLKIVDAAYKFPPDYPFVLDGLLRSPWIDFELSRPGSSAGGVPLQSALEELYGLQAEGGRKLFRVLTADVVEASVLPADRRGILDVGGRAPVFRDAPNGKMQLWGEIGEGKGGPFSAACDLAHGMGASYSTLQIMDLATGRQVMDYADNEIDVVTFAGYVVDILRWLCGDHGDGHCCLDFEANGSQAKSFANEILRIGWGNIRRRRYARAAAGDESGYLGTRNTDGGLSIFAELERAILDAEIVIRSAEILAEIRAFDRDENGKPLFPASLGIGHGDRLIGMGLAWGHARDRLVNAPPNPQQLDAQSEIKNYNPERQGWAAGWQINRGAA